MRFVTAQTASSHYFKRRFFFSFNFGIKVDADQSASGKLNRIPPPLSNQESMPIVSFSPFASRGRDWAFQVDPADAPPPCLQHPLSSCRSLFFFSSLLSIRLTRPGTTRLRNIYQPPSGSSGNIVGHATEKKEEKIELRKTQSAIAARLLRSPWLFIPEPFPEPRSTTPKPQWYAVFF